MQSLCPHCKTALDIQPEWIGQQAECPCCHKFFIIQPLTAPSGRVRQCRMAESDEDDHCEHQSFGSWLGRIIGILISVAIAVVFTLGRSSISGCQSKESIAADLVTKTLAEDKDVPAELRRLKCRSVEITGEANAKDLPSGVSDGKYFNAVATLENGEKLKILIENSAKKTSVRLNHETMARFMVTEILAKNDGVPAELRRLKCLDIKTAGEISGEDFYGSCLALSMGKKYYKAMAYLENGDVLKILVENSSARIYVRFACETTARFLVTEMLAENNEVPTKLRSLKCRSVEITGKADAKDFHNSEASPSFGKKYYNAVATLENGEKLKILIEDSAKETSAKIRW